MTGRRLAFFDFSIHWSRGYSLLLALSGRHGISAGVRSQEQSKGLLARVGFARSGYLGPGYRSAAGLYASEKVEENQTGSCTLHSPFPKSSCEKCGVARPPKVLRNNSLHKPYSIREVRRFGENTPERENFKLRPAHHSPEVCARSPRLLGFYARSQPAENVGRGRTGGLLSAPLATCYKKQQGKLRLSKPVPCCHEYYARHGILDS